MSLIKITVIIPRFGNFKVSSIKNLTNKACGYISKNNILV